MTAVRGIRAGGALALLLLVPQLAPAAWDNVFQVTCFGCRKNTTSNFPPSCTSCAPPCPCAAPCPCPTTTAFVQRTYYTPVTTFQAETRFEPVTSTRQSFFWEPVTSFTFSSFFDHCSCSCQQVATPVTSFRLRSQCSTVTNYVARTCWRPVTTFRQSCYMEAVQVPACPPPCPTCPTAVAAPPCPTCPQAAGAVTAPPVVAPAAVPPLNVPESSPPALNEQRAPSQPGLNEQRDFYMPQATPSGRPAPQPVAPAYKPERVASRTLSGSTVNGQVVSSNFSPRAGAQVVFVNAARQDVRTTADASGRFQVNLASGDWFVYVGDNANGLAYHNQLTVRSGDTAPVTVVSR